MENFEHASIDMEKLADSLGGKFKSSQQYPSSDECCVYRVPQGLRCLNPSDYTPHMVSIGPFHHGKEELRAMEEHKIKYVQYFLQRTEVSMARFLALIKEKETKLRNCYAETIDLESNEFVTIILVDAIFLIEFFLRADKPTFITNDDHLFRKPDGLSFLGKMMRYDLYLLENQLPLFILCELFELAKTTYCDIYKGVSFLTITHSGFLTDTILPINKNLIEIHLPQAEHFLDLFILCLQPSQLQAKNYFNYQNIPSVKELHQAGIKFESGSPQNLLDIKFNNGVLEIPFFTVYDSTECLYRNILAFENMHGYPRYFNDYVIIMSYLVGSGKDADLLIRNGVIALGHNERLSLVFQSLIKDCIKGPNIQYYDLIKDLEAYCKSPWNKWKANLKQNYFNTPWASISVVAAVILLLLTVTQTVCALIAL